jgi:hypothetical protein
VVRARRVHRCITRISSGGGTTRKPASAGHPSILRRAFGNLSKRAPYYLTTVVVMGIMTTVVVT